MKMLEPKRCPYCGELLSEFGDCHCSESDDDYGDHDDHDDDYGDDRDDDDYDDPELM